MKKIIYLAMAAMIMCGCKKTEVDPPTGGVNGFVTDVSSGTPIKTATILLNPGGKTTITGSDGLYQMDNLELGRYMVSAFKEDYTTTRRTIEVGATNTVLDIPMTASQGSLSIDRAHIDFGIGTAANLGTLIVRNRGADELTWSIQRDCPWVVSIVPASGTLTAGGTQGVVITIDRKKLSANNEENQTILAVNSSDGVAEVLLTVPGQSSDGTTQQEEDGWIAIDNLMIQKTDLSSGTDWNSAKSLCANSRIGGYSNWRLPTIGELSFLYTNKAKIGGFGSGSYWSSSTYNSNYPYYYDFDSGEQDWGTNSDSYRVRAVRTLP
jgi:hypothetical protein